jgi:hypothetical protein
MKRTSVAGAAAAVLLTLAVASALAGTGFQVVGAGLRSGGAPAFIAVNAHGDGGVAAAGTARIRTDLWQASISVSCIRHAGGLVLVGGVVTATSAPAGPGWGAVIVIADDGHGVRDQVGYGFEPPPPTTSVDCTVDPSIFPLAPLEHGNFTVK